MAPCILLPSTIMQNLETANDQCPRKWLTAPIVPLFPGIFFQKLGSVTFVPLWCPNFVQEIRKTERQTADRWTRAFTESPDGEAWGLKCNFLFSEMGNLHKSLKPKFEFLLILNFFMESSMNVSSFNSSVTTFQIVGPRYLIDSSP